MDKAKKKSKKLRMDKYDTQLWCEDNILGLLDVGVSHYQGSKILNEDSKKSLFCILRKQTLQTVGLKKRNKTKMKTQKNAFFLIQFEFSSSDKEIEEKVKKIQQIHPKVKKIQQIHPIPF